MKPDDFRPLQEVLECTGRKVRLWPATLYGTLKRLLEEGLIAESGERPAAELDDARRRYHFEKKLALKLSS
jgi:DNA-binding PadR family transcriptional regulator